MTDTTPKSNVIYLAGTLIRCNRCDAKWKAPEAFTALPVSKENVAARLVNFFTCENCQMTDSHWVYWKDQVEAALPVAWMAPDKKRGWYKVYLLTQPPVRWPDADQKARVKLVEEYGHENAQFRAQGDAWAYAKQKAAEFGKTHPAYFSIVVI